MRAVTLCAVLALSTACDSDGGGKTPDEPVAAGLVFATAPAATATAGETWPAFAVRVVDDDGMAFAAEGLSIAVTLSSGSGAFTTSSVTSASTLDGVATFDQLAYESAEDITFEVTATGLTGIGGVAVMIVPAAPARLAIGATPPTAATAGATWPAFSVRLEDVFGNLTPSTDPVSISLSSGGPFADDAVLSVDAVAGTATFAGVRVESAGEITFDVTADSLDATATSGLVVDIVPGAASALVFVTAPASPAMGDTWPAFTVGAEDEYGNSAAADGTVLELAQISGPGAFTGTQQATITAGLATFDAVGYDSTGLVVFDVVDQAGNLDATSTSGAQVLVDLTVAAIEWSLLPSTVEQQSVTFSPIAVETRDETGSRLVADNLTEVTLAITSGSGALLGTLTRTVQQGLAVFDDLSYDTAEGIEISVSTSRSLPPPTAAPVDVQAGPTYSTTVVRGSLAHDGAEIGHSSLYARALSHDGRYLAFESASDGVTSGEANGDGDIFVRDLVSGTTTLASGLAAGGSATGDAYRSAISGNGRFVAFRTPANGVIAGDNDSLDDIAVRDLDTGGGDVASVSGSGGEPSNANAGNVAMSTNGRYVAFYSQGSNLVGGDSNGRLDVFVRDRVRGVNSRVSIGDAEEQLPDQSDSPGISGDGSCALFTNNDQLYVRDSVTGSTELVSVTPAGVPGNAGSGGFVRADISGDGRFVLFVSQATDLVAGGAPAAQVYLRDRQSDTTMLVTKATDGGAANGFSSLGPSISADGRFAVFHSTSSNLVAGDTNALGDIFVYDRITDVIARVSLGPAAAEANGDCGMPSISGDGRFVAFTSTATNLVAGDINAAQDVFVVGNPLWEE